MVRGGLGASGPGRRSGVDLDTDRHLRAELLQRFGDLCRAGSHAVGSLVGGGTGGGRAGQRPTLDPKPLPAPEGVGYAGRGLPVTAMGWDVQPEGLTRLLERMQADYTGPRGVGIYVTENGAAYDDVVGPGGFVNDQDRLDYLDKHLRAVRDALDAGVDVRGYFAWSLMDTFEWAWGYTKRFGIVRTDFDTQERIPKASGLWYAQVAKENALPDNESAN